MGGPYGVKKIDVNTGLETGAAEDSEKLQTILGILAKSNATPLTNPVPENTVQGAGHTILTRTMEGLTSWADQ